MAARIHPLTVAQRRHLLKHVDGRAVPIMRHGVDACFVLSLRRLLIEKLVEARPRDRRARYTIATEAGRAAIAKILAEYAEALVAAGCLNDGLRPIEVLDRLKAEEHAEHKKRWTSGRKHSKHVLAILGTKVPSLEDKT